jgi:hypothetical protein
MFSQVWGLLLFPRAQPGTDRTGGMSIQPSIAGIGVPAPHMERA